MKIENLDLFIRATLNNLKAVELDTVVSLSEDVYFELELEMPGTPHEKALVKFKYSFKESKNENH